MGEKSGNKHYEYDRPAGCIITFVQTLSNFIELLAMKILLIIVLSTLMCGCGISETKYNKVISQRDSLLLEVNKLKQDVDVLKNGEERLMNFIRLHKDNCEYVKAFDNLNNLKKYHPESPLFKEYEALFSDIEKKATIIIDSIAKAERDSIKLASINELGVWKIGNYVNDFDEPTGEHFVYSEFYGTFSNSATASSSLRVYVYLYHDYNQFSNKHSVNGKILFDEYIDGTEDFHIWRDASPAKNGTKIIDRPNKKAYYYEERMAFQDIETRKYSNWINILRDTSSVFNFTVKGEYQDEYRFAINSDKLNEALKDAGILHDIIE